MSSMADRKIVALLDHKFDVSKIESMAKYECQYGPLTSVVHNDVNLTFQLFIQPNDPSEDRRKGHMGLHIQYVCGPVAAMKVDFVLFVTKGPQQTPVGLMYTENRELTSKYTKVHKSGWGSVATLPNTLEELRSEGYVDHNSVLHAFAVLFITENAFKDISRNSPASSAHNQFLHHLFQEVKTPTATNSPISNRIELISMDGQSFWVHKDVLAFNSGAFKQMLDPDKPQEARFKYLTEGRLPLENVSGGALREMLTFIYLKHTTPDFNQFAMELVPVAEMYDLKGLHLLCYQTFIEHTKNEKDIGELLRILDMAHLHRLSELQKTCLSKLEEVALTEHVCRELILKVPVRRAARVAKARLKRLAGSKRI